jgi:uncharacterized LabA/DUF88 family protein
MTAMYPKKSVAVIIDGQFLVKCLLSARLKGHKNVVELEHIQTVVEGCLNDDEELFRVYYYTAPPFQKVIVHPFTKEKFDFRTTRMAKLSESLQKSIRLAPHFALRQGELRMRQGDWICRCEDVKDGNMKASDLAWQPHLRQKEVDIKIGLDMAWLSSKRIVDWICIISGDTDFTPAMKFARREGVRIRTIGFINRTPHNKLREHSDDVKILKLREIMDEGLPEA